MNKKYVIRLDHIGSGIRPSLLEGHYLSKYDPDAFGGRGYIDGTMDIKEALVFESAADALELWKKQSTVQPLRDDGKPNRPLSSWTIEIVRLEAT